jgi:hypothetical protein
MVETILDYMKPHLGADLNPPLGVLKPFHLIPTIFSNWPKQQNNCIASSFNLIKSLVLP